MRKEIKRYILSLGGNLKFFSIYKNTIFITYTTQKNDDDEFTFDGCVISMDSLNKFTKEQRSNKLKILYDTL